MLLLSVMMEKIFKHTIQNCFQCIYINTGHCKFGDQWRFPHNYELCTKKICRESQCKFRHPRSCKFGGKYNFFQRKYCVYKPIENTNDEVVYFKWNLKNDLETEVDKLNPISYGEAPPSGIGDCSKTHLYIDWKVLDFSNISKTKILKEKKIRCFYPTPPRRGGLKKLKFWKLVGEPKL